MQSSRGIGTGGLAVLAALLLLGPCQAAVAANPKHAAKLTPETVNAAQLPGSGRPAKVSRDILIKAQVLLDRASFSPGEIDGKDGENLKKALRAFSGARGLAVSDRISPEIWAKLNENAGAPVLGEYQITADDVKGPFFPDLPTRMEEMQGLPALGYRSVREKLAEKFHVSEELLTLLNPERKFEEGERIMAPNITRDRPAKKAVRIVVDTKAQTVSVFDSEKALLAFYPASVGSREKPSPAGTLRVVGVSRNPTYRYNPDYAFKSVKSTEPFTLNPGPNGPVGTVWIALSEKSYGIHGTAEPAKVSKSQSHGCVRLTNWDAEQLAEMVDKRTQVEFVPADAEPAAKSSGASKRSKRS